MKLHIKFEIKYPNRNENKNPENKVGTNKWLTNRNILLYFIPSSIGRGLINCNISLTYSAYLYYIQHWNTSLTIYNLKNNTLLDFVLIFVTMFHQNYYQVTKNGIWHPHNTFFWIIVVHVYLDQLMN